MYEQQWKYFKRINRRGILLVAAFIPTMLLAAFLGNAIHIYIGYVGMVAVVVEFISLGATIFEIRSFLCPRCKKPFTVLFIFGPNTTGRKCVHCGLNRDEEP